jgi:hypothetical protein
MEFLRKLHKRKYPKIEIWSFNGSKFDLIFFFKYFLDEHEIKFFGKYSDLKCVIWKKMYFYDIKLIFTKGSLR